ncbi:MAG: adenylate/guanylate cyclase domain-containing protein [Desulfobulbaceae bacterium]|jgi:adenylate cyclase|nr:adenylate/guanylate cyclase domain-containing protein [Desulfobulbaceae bacterium]MDY0350849.1 adenylate/guanylate cyclase domain-containing protein [Desulfobulbaceae bacterium]
MKLSNILLVAPDESDIRDIREALIEHDVLTCTDPRELVSACLDNDVHLVIIEEEFPGHSGCELFAGLRRHRPWLAGFLLTGRAGEDLLRKALDAGFTGLLEKPVDPVKLLQRMYRAMESASHREEETRLKTLLPLYSFGEHFLAAATEQDVFDGLVNIVSEVTKASRISVMWFREDEGCLRIVAAKGLDPELARAIRLRPGDQVAGWVYQRGKPVILNKGSQNRSIFAPLLKRQEITAAVSFPITMRGEILGVLNISQSSEDARFSEADIEMLAVVCSQAAMALANVRFRAILEEKTRMRTILQQYFAPEVADLLISSGKDLVGLGEIKKVTIFFADIRESTSLVQRLTLKELRSFLNEFFQIFTETVFRSRGTVDKFMGDAVLAIFGAPIELDNQNLAAVRAAIDIQQQFERLRLRWVARREDFSIIDIAIGVTCGEVFLGNVGSHQRFDYTVIGAPVNVAQRIASSSPAGGIHVTREVMEDVREDFALSEVGSMRLRGVHKLIPVYSVDREKLFFV